MRNLAKYDFSKFYGINNMTTYATLNPSNCNNQSISYFNNFVFAAHIAISMHNTKRNDYCIHGFYYYNQHLTIKTTRLKYDK